MELKPAILASRALLREGETGKALQTILAALENEQQYADPIRTLQVLEANYNAVRKQEIKGILTFQEAQRSYAQFNDALLTTLDALENGRGASVSAPANRSGSRVWLAAGALAVLLLAVGIWHFTAGKSDARDQLKTVACPEFSGSGPKVLILPFKNIGETAVKTEEAIRSRIQKLSTNKNFPIATQLLSGLDITNLNPDEIDGRMLGERCGADMVIWGYYHVADSLNVDLRFIALHNPEGAFATGFQAFRGLPDVQRGKILNQLDDAVFAVCGVLAVRSGNADVARTWFGKMKRKDSTVREMEQILDKADSLRVGRPTGSLLIKASAENNSIN